MERWRLRIVFFLALMWLLVGCAADPAARQRMVELVQKRCLAEARDYIETGQVRDYFMHCVDS
jgi:hypothetical protein